MRVQLPAGLLIWSFAGAAIVISSLLLIAKYPGEPVQAYTITLVAIAVWVAAGVEGLLRLERIWQPPWNRLSLAFAAGLPLVLVLVAFSQCVTLRTRGHFRLPAPRQETHRVVMQDLAQNHAIGH